MTSTTYQQNKKKQQELLKMLQNQQQMAQYRKNQQSLLDDALTYRSLAGNMGKYMSGSNNATLSKIGNALYKGSGQGLIDGAKSGIGNAIKGAFTPSTSGMTGATANSLQGTLPQTGSTLANFGTQGANTIANTGGTTLANFGTTGANTAALGANGLADGMGALGSTAAAEASGLGTAAELGTLGSSAAASAGAGTAAGAEAALAGGAAAGGTAGAGAAGAGLATGAMGALGAAAAPLAVGDAIYSMLKSAKDKKNQEAMQLAAQETANSQNLANQNAQNAQANLAQSSQENLANLTPQTDMSSMTNDQKVQSLMNQLYGTQNVQPYMTDMGVSGTLPDLSSTNTPVAQTPQETAVNSPVQSLDEFRASVNPADYDTQLTPEEEAGFQDWVNRYRNEGVISPNDDFRDYDMRGFYKEYGSGWDETGQNGGGVDPADGRYHFSDKYKKPNHPTFSNESMYAAGDNAQYAGSWNEDGTFNQPVLNGAVTGGAAPLGSEALPITEEVTPTDVITAAADRKSPKAVIGDILQRAVSGYKENKSKGFSADNWTDNSYKTINGVKEVETNPNIAKAQALKTALDNAGAYDETTYQNALQGLNGGSKDVDAAIKAAGITVPQAGKTNDYTSKIAYEPTYKTESKNLANRIGEGIGSLNRVLSNPLLQGAVAGAVYQARNHDGAKALEYGVNWANNKAKSDMYGKYMNGKNWSPGVFTGNYDTDDYKAKSSAEHYRDMLQKYKWDNENKQQKNDIDQQKADTDAKYKDTKGKNDTTRAENDTKRTDAKVSNDKKMTDAKVNNLNANAKSNAVNAVANASRAKTMADRLNYDKTKATSSAGSSTGGSNRQYTPEQIRGLQNGDAVKVRRKSDGLVKVISVENYQKLMNSRESLDLELIR